MSNIYDSFDVAETAPANPYETMDAEVPNVYDTLDQPTAQEPVAFGSVGRGLIELNSGFRVGAYMLGRSTPEEFAAGMAEDETNLAKYPKAESQKQFEAAVPEQGLGAIFSHPGAIPSMLMEGVPSMIATLPAAFAGGAAGSLAGPVGTFAGTAAGVGLSAGAVEYGNAFKQYLISHGVNIADPTQSLVALNDKNMVNEAHHYAAKRAGVSATFNAFGAAVGGKVALRFFTPETKWLSKDAAKGLGALGGVAAGTQAATEVGQGVATGEPIDPNQVMVDSFLAGLTNMVPMAAPGLAERIRRGKRIKVEQDITGEHQLVDETGRPVDTTQDATVDAAAPSQTAPVPTIFGGLEPGQIESMKTRLKTVGPDSAKPEEWNRILADTGPDDFMKKNQQTALTRIQSWLKEIDEANGGEEEYKKMFSAGARIPLKRGETWNIRAHKYVENETNKFAKQYGSEDSVPMQVVPHSAVETDAAISKADMLRHLEEKQLVVNESETTTRPEEPGASPIPIGENKPIVDRTLTVSKETREVGIPNDASTPVVSSTRGLLEPVAKVAVSERHDTQGRKILVVENVDKPMILPTESDWGELVVQRIGRYAAESGFDAVSWPKSQAEAEPGPSAGPADTAVTTSDEIAPVKKLADQRRADRITVSVRGDHGSKIKLQALSSAAFADTIAPASPLPSGKGRINDTVTNAAAKDGNLKGALASAQLALKALREILPEFKLTKPIQFILGKGLSTSFGDFTDMGSHYEVRIHLDVHKSSVDSSGVLKRPSDVAASIYTTMWHEFGHALAMDKWGSTDHSTQQLFMDRWRQEMIDPLKDRARTEGQNELTRRNYVKVLQFGLPESHPNTMTPGQISPSHFHYITSFAEWFAEQVAKWSTTSVAPRTVLEKWFSALNQKLEALFKYFKTKFPNLTGEAVPEIQTWLDSFVTNIGPQLNVGWFAQAARSAIQNAKALRRGGAGAVAATPMTPASAFTRNMMNAVFGTSNVPAGALAGAALMDKFNVFYKYMISLPQLADRNPHIWGLQRYTEAVRAMVAFRKSMIDEAATTVKLWQGIGKKNRISLDALIEEYSSMSYRTPAEIAQGVKRMPSAQELQALFAQVNATPEVIAVFGKIVKDFNFMLDKYADNMMTSAMQITDPAKSALAIAGIQAEITRMKKVPYFPWMRFGNFTLTVRDGNGKVVHFETFELERQRDRAFEAAQSMYPTQGPGAFQIFRGALPEDVKPLLGMPPGLMDKIKDSLNLSHTQEKMLEELRFELAPGQSFKHRFQMKERTSGYSDNFLRSYGNYMFHGSSHIARTKYVEPMKRFIAHTRFQSEWMPDGQNGTKLSKIASFMDHHLAEIIDAKSDFVRLKGMIFHFALGMNPAAAALNLSQQLIGTAPFLMAKFGDVKGVASLVSAQVRWKTYWKEATYNTLAKAQPGDFFSRAMAEGIRSGPLSEAMAPELAAVSQDRNLLKYFGKPSEKIWHHVAKASSWMFQMTEQMNRRVTFTAALELGMKHPTNKYVMDTVATNQLEYTRLRGEGWTHPEASAYLTAVDAVRATQFEYASYARPRLFQGKAGALFIFKSFQLNTLFMLWNYPSAAVRSMLIMGFLGGLMGIPGTEDLSDILKVIGYQLFGKDWNLEREARQFVKDVSDGTVDPGIVLNGISREGYGIPAVMDMLGEHIGVGDVPMPVVDRSRNIGVGPILPVPLTPLFGPVSDPNAAIAQTAQRASGAGFGVGFNIYKTLVDPQLSAYDMKRWERMMPTALRSVSRMYRVYNEGMERSASGNPVQTFDPNDTEQMMEIISMGLGYQPLALTNQYDRMRFLNDAKHFYELGHNGLLKQLSTAYTMGDKDEIANVIGAIKKFNSELPKEAKGYALTADAIKQSIKSRDKNFKILKSGGVLNKRDAGLVKVLDPLIPEVEVGRRRVH